MSPSPRRRNRPSLPWLLFAAVALRSLVAPGYEFVNIDGNTGFKLGVAWCPGLNGINRVNGLDETAPRHSHDEESSGSGGSGHFTATCGLWTGTTPFVNHNVFSDEGLLYLQAKRYSGEHIGQPPSLSYHRNHPPRAPPASPVI